MKKKYDNGLLWLKVTNDKYELPLAVADTVEELARLCKIDPNSIYQSRAKYRRENRRQIYVKVDIKECEDEKCQTEKKL